MLGHNAQANDLAVMALAHSTSPQVRALATRTANAGHQENLACTAWLLQWGDDPYRTEGTPLDNPGMADVATVDQLQGLTGSQFDELWLSTMAIHHQGAIEVAQRETNGGQNVDAMTMARSVISARQAELRTIKQI
jgi:uncharacterized protein (DUF305 family)